MNQDLSATLLDIQPQHDHDHKTQQKRTSLLQCMNGSDIRGQVPRDLNGDMAARIALAFARFFDMGKIVIGHDVRLSSPEFVEKITEMLLRHGVDVVDMGLCGTEELYHAVFSTVYGTVDGGIMVTASHNPAQYNGMKLVQEQARPVFSNNGLTEIIHLSMDDDWYRGQVASKLPRRGHLHTSDAHLQKIYYAALLLSLVPAGEIRRFRVVANSGNGCSGPMVDFLARHLPIELIHLHSQPDGHFPNGVPNPLLPEKRNDTAQAVLQHKADLGLAWDGDFDRCFFFDETGRFIDSYYITGLLAEELLRMRPGGTVLHDPRLYWNTREVVLANGGTPVMTRTGHAFIKEKMRALQAIYGGEVSGHHYFRDFGYCDSGMLTWLLVCRLLSRTGKSLAELCNERMAAYPASGEINSSVEDAAGVIARVAQKYQDGSHDLTDGLSVEYPNFRFNLRRSNTEELLRLNVETRGDQALLEDKTAELLSMIRS